MFTPIGDKIRFGLAGIKGVGEQAAQKIIEEREATTVVLPGDRVTIDETLNIRIAVGVAPPVEVRVGGAIASTLNPYDLVGEASLLENLQSPGGEEHPPAAEPIAQRARGEDSGRARRLEVTVGGRDHPHVDLARLAQP